MSWLEGDDPGFGVTHLPWSMPIVGRVSTE